MRIKMQDKVKEILIRMNHCRDSDVYLIYEIWKQELAKYNYDINNMKLVPVLKLVLGLANSIIPSLTSPPLLNIGLFKVTLII